MVRGMILKQLVHSPSSLPPPLVSQTEDLIQGNPRMALLTEQWSLLYLPSSSFSLFSLSSFSLCSRASRLFSASSLVASSGSVVPAEVLGEAAAVTVYGEAGADAGPGAGADAGAGTGAGAGADAGAGAGAEAAVQTGTGRKPVGNKTQRTKQKLAFPTPQA